MADSNTIIAGFVDEFRRVKSSADKALAQLQDEQFFFRLNSQQNSIWVIIKHMAGNMRSRWTDFLTTDGEKPDRNREGEFIEDRVTREQAMRTWEQGWGYVFDALAAMRDSNLTRTVRIGGEELTAAAAIARQMAHYGWHVGQIVLLAKHLRGEQWNYVTAPPASGSPRA
jgi:hypothetical protein